MNQWVGFKSCKIPVNHDSRTDGKESSYSMRKRIELAISTAIAFSTKSLHLIVYLGSIITTIAVLIAIILVIKTIITGIDVSGWVTLFISMWLIAGILIMIIGIIAVYIGNIFEEVKHRPSYIVSEKINFPED